MRKFPIIAIQLLLLTTFANAQSSTSIVKAFGLFGTWAYDCSQAPGPANAYAAFSLTSRGDIELRDDFGADYDEMIYRVVDAQRLSQFRLALRQVLTTDDRIVLDTVTLRAAGRIRNWSSRLADGSNTLVEGGAMPSADGKETEWMTRCDVRRADDVISAPREPGHRPSFLLIGALPSTATPKETTIMR
jgi:hypothetical protein